MITALIIFTAIYVWLWFEHREEQRRLTSDQRARRARLELEIQVAAQVGGEEALRRMLLDGLRKLEGRRRAQEYLRERYDIDIPLGRAAWELTWRERYRRRRRDAGRLSSALYAHYTYLARDAREVHRG